MSSLLILTKRNLLLNKRKTILTLLTIIFSAILITSSGIIPLNIYNDYKKKTEEESGKYQLLVNGLSENKINELSNDGNIIQYGKSAIYGIKNNEKFSMFYYDKNAFELSPFKLLSGRLAKNKNEIVLDEYYLEKYKLPKEVGAKIQIKYLDMNNKEHNQEFILSGISSSTSQAKVKEIYFGFVSEDALSEIKKENLLWTLYANTKSSDLSNIEIYRDALIKVFNLDREQVRINDSYINSNKVDPSLIFGALIVVLVVVMATFMVIYSIFYISINEKISEYGKLRALGTTRKQIKGVIFREGLYISVIAIPIGVFLGYIISNFISYKFLFKEMEFNIYGSLVIVILAIAITLITVIISLIKPATIAMKISPVEAIKYNNVLVKDKKRKSKKRISIRELTILNMKRNKHRTIITIISLSISFLLLVLIGSIVESFNMDKAAKQYVSGDFLLETTRDSINYKYGVFDEKLMMKIKSLDGIKEINNIGLVNCSFNNEGTLKLYNDKNKDIENITSYILGYNEQMLKELKSALIDGEINIDGLKNKNEIIIFRNSKDNKFLTKVGDEVKLFIGDDDSNVKIFKIQGIVNADRMESIDMVGLGEVFLTEKECLDSIISKDSTIKLQINASENLEGIESTLREVFKENKEINFKSQEAAKKELLKDFVGIKIVAYSLALIIAIISLVNYINTMLASIIARKKELGILQAIGITNKQLKKILLLEGNIYLLGSLVIGIVLGSIFGAIIVLAIKSEAIFISYKYPIFLVSLLIVIALVIQSIIMTIMIRKVNKESIIERINN